MTLVNVFEVKAKLSEYLDRAASGEHIVICRHNTPVAELRPIEAARVDPRPIGRLAGRPTFEVPAAFFEPLSEDELAAWDGIAAGDPLASYAATRQQPGKVAEAGPKYGTKRQPPAPRRTQRPSGRKR